ncbi:uncharacterized protein F4812DRAFT_94237 [Daldinia caldariorum]|uniref:uncharacterized protein n=1 Tax=Daldinia caldariorum TaxID=326644 RepID=UPI00200735DD|nr:uncharacterized protein F4812DRAFT_94237 [Daldinia caldariorum]KAI1466031.1 hypothetical protein F4812DRAFT_94237 [Daldinia caldariorum]
MTPRTLLITPPRTVSKLQRLPYEIMAYIVEYLDIDEIFDLSLSCRHFQYLVKEESFCRAIIATQASHTAEAREAQRTGQFSRALRRVAKRRQAFSRASPYVVGIVALADSYEYIHGILCYIVEARPKRWLRILDLHGSASYELVVDIPTLVQEAVPRSATSRKYKFRVLYHANGITSCLFSFALPNTENWLLIFKADEQLIVAALQLDSAAKIFVRNNKDYLYVGTHSEEGADGFRKWVLMGYDIEKRSWFSRKMHLTDFVGYDIGSTVCFEIIDDYFYGLSNQTDFEIRETDWNSYYHCFRFPLDDPDVKNKQTMKTKDSWRRQHGEGPIDDRWSFLKLEKDEASGRINIVESRKEWLNKKSGSLQSGSLRTYYVTEVIFDENSKPDSDGESATAHGNLPAEQIITSSLTRYLNKPPGSDIRFRSPENVHPGDDSSMALVFTRSQTHLRAYQRCCSTYLDLVDDVSSGSLGPRHLRLRTGFRKSQTYWPSWKYSDYNYEVEPKQKSNEEPAYPYQPNRVYFWPPKQDTSNRTPFVDDIYQILNPPGCLGGIISTSDERSVVYATGEDTNGLKILVYLSFDPAARLAGMLREKYVLGEQDMSSLPSNETEGGYHSLEAGKDRCMRHFGSTDKLIGDLSRHPLPSYISDIPSMHTAIMSPPEGCKPWASTEQPMYWNLPGKIFAFAH